MTRFFMCCCLCPWSLCRGVPVNDHKCMQQPVSPWCHCAAFTRNTRLGSGCGETLLVRTVKCLPPVTFYSGCNLFSMRTSHFSVSKSLPQMPLSSPCIVFPEGKNIPFILVQNWSFPVQKMCSHQSNIYTKILLSIPLGHSCSSCNSVTARGTLILK